MSSCEHEIEPSGSIKDELCFLLISYQRTEQDCVHRGVRSSYRRFGRHATLSLPSSSVEPELNKKTA
jgi:hypothetical protein